MLSVQNIQKSYGKRQVLHEVSLTVQPGEAVGLLGPNGAGKTTSFYSITGIIQPDKGNIFLNEQDITALPIHRRAQLGIGYLPQEASVFRGLNTAQNIMAVLEIVEKSASKRKERLAELLKEFSIEHVAKTSSIALSGGERRRLEIARALAADPRFLLLDEPLAGIDPIAIADVKNLIAHLKDRGLGVLITDHNVYEMLEIVDRAYIIYDGRVLMHGSPKEIAEHPEVRRVYLGEGFQLKSFA